MLSFGGCGASLSAAAILMTFARRHDGARLLPALAAAAIVGMGALALALDIAPVPRQPAQLPGLTAEDAGNASGIVVTSVQGASAAARAGIVAGDRITAIDGHPMPGLSAVRSYLGTSTPPVIDMQLYHYHSRRNVRLHRSEESPHVAQDTRR